MITGYAITTTGNSTIATTLASIAESHNCTIVVIDEEQEKEQLYRKLHNVLCEDVDLDWWEAQQRQIEADKKMRESWKLQKKLHHFHQSKWGPNKPKFRS